MKHVLSVLKKFIVPIIMVFVLLFGQAMCDLSLPDYTSRIVNVGIQQSGIDSIVLEAISETEYNKLKLLLTNEEDSILDSSYELVSIGDSEYIDKYPLLEKENIYVLTDKHEDLEDVLLLPIIMIYQSSQEGFDLGMFNIPEGLSFVDFLSTMNEQQLNEFIANVKTNFTSDKLSLLEQTAVMYVKDEYKNIGIDVEKIQMNYIIITGIKMVSLSFLAMGIAILTAFITSKIAANFSKNLRSKVVNKVMTYSNSEFENLSVASLITRSTNDIQQVQMLIVMLLRIVFYAPIMGIGALTKVSNSEMGWIIALSISIILSVVIILFSITIPRFNKVQKLIDKVNLVAREILTGSQVIRAFANEKYEEKRFDGANKDLTKLNLFVNRVMTVMMPTMNLIMNLTCILIVWIGASKIDAGIIQVGNLLAFITYTMQIIMSFLMISMVSIMIPRALVSIKRIGEVLDKDSSINNVEKPLKFDKSKKGIVEFKDVYFRYPDAVEDVLQNISFKATPGTTTAFIGSTGSGKSTLINLIPRFFDVTSGKILIDGIDIKNANIKDLRSKIGYVPQKGMLFTGTIKSNIGFGLNRITKEQLEIASKVSQSYDFINEKEDKFDSEISQGGTNVSGGQRQRLSIARAIAINPEIYIFDDSFSALDYKTDLKLRKELSKHTKDATIFIVAQRISTVMNADQIIVLDNGHIVGIGKHKELLQNCEVYKEIALSQLSKEELENA